MMNNRQKTSKNTLKTGKVRVSIVLEIMKNTNFWSKSELKALNSMQNTNVRYNYNSEKSQKSEIAYRNMI